MVRARRSCRAHAADPGPRGRRDAALRGPARCWSCSRGHPVRVRREIRQRPAPASTSSSSTGQQSTTSSTSSIFRRPASTRSATEVDNIDAAKRMVEQRLGIALCRATSVHRRDRHRPSLPGGRSRTWRRCAARSWWRGGGTRGRDHRRGLPAALSRPAPDRSVRPASSRSGSAKERRDLDTRGSPAGATARNAPHERLTRPRCPEATIENLLREERTFPPPAGFVANALLSDPGIYERARATEEGFRDVLDRGGEPPRLDGALDRALHLGHALREVVPRRQAQRQRQLPRPARRRRLGATRSPTHWEGEPGDTRTITYRELLARSAASRTRCATSA